MQENRININDLVQTDEDGNSYIPYNVSIRLVNGRTLKAVAKVEYANIVIADIWILERYGRISIQFPSKEFEEKSGRKKVISIAFPNVPETSKELNRGIMQAYKEKCEETYAKRASEVAEGKA